MNTLYNKSPRFLVALFILLVAHAVQAQNSGEKAVRPGQIVIANNFATDISVGIDRTDGSKDNAKIRARSTEMLPCGTTCTIVVTTRTDTGETTARRIVQEQKRYLLFVDKANKRIDIGELPGQN